MGAHKPYPWFFNHNFKPWPNVSDTWSFPPYGTKDGIPSATIYPIYPSCVRGQLEGRFYFKKLFTVLGIKGQDSFPYRFLTDI